MGVRNYQNDNLRKYSNSKANPENPVFSGFFLYSKKLSDTLKIHKNVPVTNR